MESKWEPARINNGLWMSRCVEIATTGLNTEYNGVECRQMYWWEKVWYFRARWRVRHGR